MTRLYAFGMRLCSEDGSGGEGYMSSPSLVWVTQDGSLAIGDMPSVGGYRGRRAALQPKHTLPLALSESVLEVKLIMLALCQSLCLLMLVWLLCLSFVLSYLPAYKLDPEAVRTLQGISM